MGEEKRVNYAYKEIGQFRVTYSCSHPEVEELDFRRMMKMPQSVREKCSGIGEKALCEVCEHYGQRNEFVSRFSGEVRTMYSGESKDIPEEK